MAFFKCSLLVLTLWSGALWADSEVICKGGDCLANGWFFDDFRSGNHVETFCLRGDCLNYGWDIYQNGYLVETDRCRGAGCFVDGWIAREARYGNFLYDVRCTSAPDEATDCMTSGWVARDYRNRRIEAVCVDGDCRGLGWDVYSGARLHQAVSCKAGGCFEEGWHVSP